MAIMFYQSRHMVNMIASQTCKSNTIPIFSESYLFNGPQKLSNTSYVLGTTLSIDSLSFMF